MRAISAKRAGRGRSQDMSQEMLITTGTHGVSANECSSQGLQSEHGWRGCKHGTDTASPGLMRAISAKRAGRGRSQEVKITTGTYGVSELECSSQGLKSKDGYLKFEMSRP